MRVIKRGIDHREVFYPTAQQAASAMGNHGVDVVATTAIILYFEAAADHLASPYYEVGEVSVGTSVQVDHLAPAWIGQSIVVTAILTRQQGRRIEFELTAHQGETLVMRGRHIRAVVDRRRFETATKVPDPKKKQLDFWFDFHSPWCYFASFRIGDIAREFNAQLNWKPVHLANLNDAVKGRKPLQANAGFVSWYQQDQRDTAALCGLPFEPHRDYPKRPSRALRCAIYANDCGLAESFVKSIMRGYWSEQKDISDVPWLKSEAARIGLDEGQIDEVAMRSQPYKDRLNQNLQSAVQHNLFGLPAVIVDGKIFWGNDRLDLLRHYLSGRLPGGSVDG